MTASAPERPASETNDTRTNDTGPEDARSGDAALVTISKTAENETFNKHDDRHSQEYWGSLVLKFPIMLDARALPAWRGTGGKWARDTWSNYQYMLGSVCSMAQRLARFSIDGVADPTEVGLGEKGKYPDLPPKVPDWPLLSSGENPFGDPIRPFDELERLWLSTEVNYSRMDSPAPEDDVHDLYLKTELRAEVERPSMIPSKHELRGVQSRISPKIFPPVRAALARAVGLACRRAEVRAHVHRATKICKTWAEHFASEAREETGYRERLRALQQEVETAAYDRAAGMFEEHTDEEIAEELGAPVAVVRTCKRLWDEYMNVGPGLSPSISMISPREAMKDLDAPF
jgi:hypothetical protein